MLKVTDSFQICSPAKDSIKWFLPSTREKELRQNQSEMWCFNCLYLSTLSGKFLFWFGTWHWVVLVSQPHLKLAGYLKWIGGKKVKFWPHFHCKGSGFLTHLLSDLIHRCCPSCVMCFFLAFWPMQSPYFSWCWSQVASLKSRKTHSVNFIYKCLQQCKYDQRAISANLQHSVLYLLSFRLSLCHALTIL